METRAAVVTGGSRGIGAAIVRRLADAGLGVVFGYHGDKQAADAVLKEVYEAGGRAWAVAADLADPDQPRRLFSTASGRLGRLDVLVNNAAVPARAELNEITVERFDRVFAINTRAALLATQHAAERMSTGGRIINISSVSTSWPGADEMLYAASKAALEQVSRVASRALGARGITVNTIAPGTTDTAFLHENVPEEVRRTVAGMTPLGRLGAPEDIAAVVAYLASPDAGWLTGQNIRADGGLV